MNKIINQWKETKKTFPNSVVLPRNEKYKLYTTCGEDMDIVAKAVGVRRIYRKVTFSFPFLYFSTCTESLKRSKKDYVVVHVDDDIRRRHSTEGTESNKMEKFTD